MRRWATNDGRPSRNEFYSAVKEEMKGGLKVLRVREEDGFWHLFRSQAKESGRGSGSGSGSGLKGFLGSRKYHAATGTLHRRPGAEVVQWQGRAGQWCMPWLGRERDLERDEDMSLGHSWGAAKTGPEEAPTKGHVALTFGFSPEQLQRSLLALEGAERKTVSKARIMAPRGRARARGGRVALSWMA